MTRPDLQWYAIRTKPTANPNRQTVVVGASYETYRDRRGRVRKRKVKGTGQREFVIETLLRKRGFAVFLPTKSVFRRKSKYNREKQAVARPLLVGWVFVGWSEHETRWADLIATNLVAEVAGIEGQPYRIPSAKVGALQNRWGGTRAPACEQFMPTHREYAVGDHVRVVDGPFEGVEVKVTDLFGAKARVMLDLLGGTQEFNIDAMLLEAA